MRRLVTRRDALRAGVATGASALLANSVIARALASAPASGRLTDIEHVVILIQENRSFDNYFGVYRGVAGFGDKDALHLNDGSGLTVFAQPGYPGGFAGDHLYPFHLDSFSGGECTNDINHSWAPQHGFKQYHTNPTLFANGLTPTFPGTFQTDLATAGELPQVSWVLAPLTSSEHPPAPTEQGEFVTAQVLNTLVSNPAIWAKTALFVTYDENGGWRLRLQRHLRPHVAAAVPRDSVRRGGAQPDRMAALGHRRSDERVQLRRAELIRAGVAAAVRGRSA